MGLSRIPQGNKTIVVIGGQWGDEGKGKVVDMLAEGADTVARLVGGPNAGHTIRSGDEHLALHLIPSGIRFDKNGTVNVIGRGVAFDPRVFEHEVAELLRLQFSITNLRLDYRAKLIMPFHILLDWLAEAGSVQTVVGTTKRGVGPCYEDHVGRRGIIVNDLFNTDIFVKKLKKALSRAQTLCYSVSRDRLAEIERGVADALGCDPDTLLDLDAIVEAHKQAKTFLNQFVCDTDEYVRDRCGSKRIILEGAQGLMLGIEDGTYPYVTSCDCSLQGMAKAAGIHEDQIDFSVNVIKAYLTRVGGGPFPTEIFGEEADKLRELGHEYGTTTGRPRRVGWLDIPQLRYLMRINGRNERNDRNIALMKLDVLDTYKTIRVCTEYIYKGPDYRVGAETLERGHRLSLMNPDPEVLARCEPQYVEIPGWQSDTSACRSLDDLPPRAVAYLKLIEDKTDVNFSLISVGADRTQTIMV